MLEYNTENPAFRQVVDIACHESTVLLYVQKYIANFFSSHYNAFVINSIAQFVVVNLWTLQDYHPVTVKSNFYHLTIIPMHCYHTTTEVQVGI